MRAFSEGVCVLASRIVHQIALSFLLIITAGCGTTITTDYSERVSKDAARNIVFFMDGTGNDLNSATNVSRLHAMAKNQNRRDLVSYYTSGVGADSSFILGLATGLGIGRDVRNSYLFLVENYRGNSDVVHLYGYSRGAYAARIFAGFIYSAGLVDITKLPDGEGKFRSTTREERDALIASLYAAYKGKHGLQKRRDRVEAVMRAHGLTRLVEPDEFTFAAVGLWDTVEALGLPDRRENFDFPNRRYEDQVCNMDRVFHAVALDDNRATAYTPILMSLPRLWQSCTGAKRNQNGAHVKEVWFAGAHSDVGGGYSRGYLSGVSLNWMLDNVRNIGVGGVSVFPKSAEVYADPLDIIHDAEADNLGFRLVFMRRARDLQTYAAISGQKLRLHHSVVERLRHKDGIMTAEDRLKKSGKPPKTLQAVTQAAIMDCIDMDRNSIRKTSDCGWLDIESSRARLN